MQKKETSKKKSDNLSNVFFILKLIFKANPLRIFITIIRHVGEKVFGVFFFVYLIQYIYICIEEGTPFNNVLNMLIFACSLHIGMHIFSVWYDYYVTRTDPKIYEYIYGKVISKATEIELNLFERPDFYDSYTRALNEAATRTNSVLNTISSIIGALSSVIATLILIIQTDPFLVVFSIIPLLLSCNLMKKNNKLWYERDMEMTRDNRVAEYTKRVFYEKKYAQEIRLYNIKDMFFNMQKESYDSMGKIMKRYGIKMAIINILSSLMMEVIAIFSSFVYVAYRVVVMGASNGAAYIALLNAVNSVAWELFECVYLIMDFNKQGEYIRNIKKFLEYEPKFKKEKRVKDFKENFDKLSLENITYTYEGATNPVINNITLDIKKGEKIAFVGHNGAGKTTLVKLIMGLYDVSEGRIVMNNNNIKDYDINDYYDKFATVFQDFQLFSLSIAENVIMKEASTTYEKEKVKYALEKVGFTEKLNKLSNGIDSMLTREFDDEGVNLSGGEAQKIAIARVHAKDSDIVILDEPSSALDPIAEFNMYKNMMDAAKNKTVIFISHRLSSARMADKIYMLEKGAIIEQGSHEELMDLNGKYSEMFNKQAENYIDMSQEVSNF